MPETNKTITSDKRTNTSTTKTTKTVKRVVKRRRKKKLKHSKLLWIGFTVAAIPCILVVYILFSALIDTGKPIFGDRYENDLDPKITQSQKNAIEYNIKTIEDVENLTLSLISSTLRITIDMTDTLNVEDAKSIGLQAADAIKEVLPYETYFTQYGNKKMYDFEITVVDQRPSNGVTPAIQVVVYKNGVMPTVGTQVLSESVNPEYVKQLEVDRKAKEEAQSN